MTHRPPLAASLPLVLAAAFTSWFAFFAWRGFISESGALLGPLLFGIALVSAVGLVTRWVRLPAPLVLSSQILTTLLFANAAWGSSVLPTPASIVAAVKRIDASITTLGQFAAPVPAVQTDAVVVLILGALVLHTLVDFFALTLGRVSLAGLPLLAVYAIPISVLDGNVNWIVFTFSATGFLLMLALHEGARIGRWGRHFGAPPGGDRLAAFGAQDARRHPVAIGGVAVVCAILIPIAIPTLDINLFSGGGSGSGGNEVRITNPMTDLHRDLTRGNDVPVMTVTATGGEPRYLRVSALTRYTGATWTPGDRDLPSENAAEGTIPPPPGLPPSVPRRERPVQIRVHDTLESLWLPTPLAVSAVNAGADWRYDAAVMDFHSADNSIDTAGLTYTLTELIPGFSAEGLAAARPAPFAINSTYASVPGDLPSMVSDLAEQVTSGLRSSYEKAVALQNWFRSTENFTYSLETEDGAVVGNGNDALVRFLSPEGRVGYCEQFASAMAVMARSLGIPARVSVGFLAPRRLTTSTYEFSSHDLHAWPEIYFEGFGWVMFEPTPQDRASVVPPYSRADLGPDPTITTSTAQPSDNTQSARPSERPSAQPQSPEDQTAATSDNEQQVWWPTLLAIGLVLTLLVLAGLPRFLRSRRSARRWRRASDPLEAAWLELRDAVYDVGRAWPEGGSLRQIGRQLVQWFGPAEEVSPSERPPTGPNTNPAAVMALEELVGELELHRYAPARSIIPEFQTDRTAAAKARTAICVAGLRGGVTPRARRRSIWFPRSLLTPQRADDLTDAEPLNSLP